MPEKKSCAGPFRRFRLKFQSRRRAQGIFALRHRIIEPLVFSGDLFDLANEGLAGGNLRKTGEVEMVTLDTFIVNRSRVDKSSGPKGIYIYIELCNNSLWVLYLLKVQSENTFSSTCDGQINITWEKSSPAPGGSLKVRNFAQSSGKIRKLLDSADARGENLAALV